MNLTVFGHKITWLETKNFLKEVSSVVGLAITIAHGNHLTAFYGGLGTASATLLTITTWVNVQTTAKIKVANATAPLVPPAP